MTVKHDFLAALAVAGLRCGFLFDDYTERRGYGVKRLLDREMALKLPSAAVEIIDVEWEDKTEYGEAATQKMALLLGDNCADGRLRGLYSPAERRMFSMRYLVWRESRKLARKTKSFVRRGVASLNAA
jgi:hypothetical protein